MKPLNHSLFKLTLLFLIITAIAAPHPAAAQSSNGSELVVNFVEGAQVPGQSFYHVRAYVSVLDGSNNPVPGLTARDFAVAEDSQPIEIASVGEVASPINLILVIDTSQSMQAEEKITAVKAAAAAFVNRLNPDDKAALVSFNLNISRDAELTTDHALVADRIQLLNATSGGTCLYDAAYQAVEIASGVQGRRAVVLLTDGRDEVKLDNGSSKACSTYVLDDVIRFAADTPHVPVYTVAVGSEADSPSLARLANLTGGLHAELAGAQAVESYFKLLSKQIGSQYEILYRSSAGAGAHTLTVEATVGGSKLSGARTFTLPELAAFPIIEEPDDGDVISGSAEISVDIEGSGDINRLALLVNGEEVQSDSVKPFEFEWDSGKFIGKTVKLEIVIYDSGGNEIARSEAVSASVEAPPQQPTATAVPLPTPTPPVATDTQSKTDPLPIITAVGATLAVAVAAFFAFRWWQGRKQSAYVVWSGAQQGEPFATLVLEQSDSLAVGRRFDLCKPAATVGRSSTNDIVIPDRPVSRTHAELREKDGVLTIVEAKSEQDGKMLPPRYGTFVNDAPVPAAGKPLKNGDRIRLGSRTVLRLERAEAAREDMTYDSLAVDDRTFDQLAPAPARKDPDATREYEESASQPAAPEAPDDTREFIDPGSAQPDQTREMASGAIPPTIPDDKTRYVPSGDEPSPDDTRELS